MPSRYSIQIEQALLPLANAEKAIGWALRDYARWNPHAVKRYVKRSEKQLSGLRIREALKHL